MTDGEAKTFRSKGQLIGGIAVAVIGGGVGVGSIFSARNAVFALAWAFVGLLCILMGARLASARIRVDSGGIHVVNFFNSFHLDWTEVQGFEMGRWSAFPSVCLINLNDGRHAHAFGLQESTNFANGSAQKMVDELTEELAWKRSAARPGTDPSTGSAQRQLFS
ncbi:MAG: hypothetical protein JST59_09405 [Actinobacteria bacterium]|nr:hypothetical protein [Actinomycetota bacterium]